MRPAQGQAEQAASPGSFLPCGLEAEVEPASAPPPLSRGRAAGAAEAFVLGAWMAPSHVKGMASAFPVGKRCRIQKHPSSLGH